MMFPNLPTFSEARQGKVVVPFFYSSLLNFSCRFRYAIEHLMLSLALDFVGNVISRYA